MSGSFDQRRRRSSSQARDVHAVVKACLRRALAVGALALVGCGTSSPAGSDGGADAASAADAPDAFVPTSATLTTLQTITIASGMGHLAFPDLTRLPDGRILLVYRRGASHVDPTGRIMKQFGSPDATTWTAPEVLYDAPSIDDRDPSVTTLANGDVMVNYFQYVTQQAMGTTLATHHVFVGRSTDGGKTFGAFTQVDQGTMTPQGPTLNGAGIWVDANAQPLLVGASSSAIVEIGGRMVLPVYGGNPLNLTNLAATPKSRVSLYTSMDGVAWTENPVLASDAPDSWLQEPAVLPLASGKTLMQMRTATGTSPGNAGKLMQSTSGDGAKAWSAPSSFPFVGHAPELAQMKSSLLLSGYRELDDALTHEWTSLSWSLDEGLNWSAPIRVRDCGAVECGYPAILELEDGKFLYAYYAPGGTAIVGVIMQATLE